MAIHSDYRRKGIATAMIKKMLASFPAGIDITVTTFREDDAKETAPRSLYRKFGFVEDELLEEFNYPHRSSFSAVNIFLTYPIRPKSIPARSIARTNPVIMAKSLSPSTM